MRTLEGPDIDIEYGISSTNRMLLLVAFSLFVLGGSTSVAGVAEKAPIVMSAGLVITVLAIGMYTLIVMFSSVYGPPAALEFNIPGSILTIKPATFLPAPESRVYLITACCMLSIASITVVLGFKHNLTFLWIPGYCLGILGFLVYTFTVMYGPVDITPGAVVVAFPDDCLPIPGNSSAETPPREAKAVPQERPRGDFQGSKSRASSSATPAYDVGTPPSPVKSVERREPGERYRESRRMTRAAKDLPPSIPVPMPRRGPVAPLPGQPAPRDK